MFMDNYVRLKGIYPEVSLWLKDNLEGEIGFGLELTSHSGTRHVDGSTPARSIESFKPFELIDIR